MRVSGTLVCLGILAAACGGTEGTPSGNGDKLYAAVSTQTSQSIEVIDSRSHNVERHLPMGVPSTDWKHLYSIASTSLVDTDPQTGATLSTLPLGHAYRLPDATLTGVPGGLSPNGDWLVVERYDLSARSAECRRRCSSSPPHRSPGWPRRRYSLPDPTRATTASRCRRPRIPSREGRGRRRWARRGSAHE